MLPTGRYPGRVCEGFPNPNSNPEGFPHTLFLTADLVTLRPYHGHCYGAHTAHTLHVLHKASGLALSSFLIFLTFLTTGEETLLQKACFQREPLCPEPVTPRALCGVVDQLSPRGPASWSPLGSKMNWSCSELGPVPLSPSFF